ncbi:MAG: hypothetical protein IMZ52_02330 [Actinobacteria bacterium]|nr:hypothetical protein [Actinomycetota bacterium]MBE3114860.1 hypothetical protein [Actinomycetota bacterium]
MKELNEEEMKQALNEVNLIILKMVNGEIKSVKGIIQAIEERIKNDGCKEWLLSVLIADHAFKSVQEFNQMIDKTKAESQVMFG